jgi:hypothetical protein
VEDEVPMKFVEEYKVVEAKRGTKIKIQST